MFPMSKKRKLEKAREAEYKKAVDELNEVRARLGEAYTRFDHITDPVVMDTCILEISALSSRYNTAVHNIKALYFQ